MKKLLLIISIPFLSFGQNEYLTDSHNNDFISNLEIKIWDRLSFGWNKGFEYLKRFVEEHGHSQVLTSYCSPDGFKLGSWVNNRRVNYRNGILSSDKISDLDPETVYFLNKILNDLNLKKIRNNILSESLPTRA